MSCKINRQDAKNAKVSRGMLSRLSFFLLQLVAPFTLTSAQPAGEAHHGWYDIKHGDETVEIYRDDYGVPLVYAKTFQGIWFGQGYVTAEDRLWQLELYRADARGEFAEMGLWRAEPSLTRELAVRHDINARRERIPDADYLDRLKWFDTDVSTMLSAYCEGINAFIAKAPAEKKLPTEFTALGIQPRPWTVADLLCQSDLVSRRLGGGGWESLVALKLRDKLMDEKGRADGWGLFNDLFFYTDANVPSTEPPEDFSSPGSQADLRGVRENDLPPGWTDSAMLDQAIAGLDEELRLADSLGLIADWGSLAFSIAPEKSATRHAMLYSSWNGGGGKVSPFYEVLLSGPASQRTDSDRADAQMNVRGASIVGLPGVFMGATPENAWAVAAGRGANADYYIESLDRMNSPRYLYGGIWYDMIEREEKIKIRGDDGKITENSVNVRQSMHGPVLAFSEKAAQAVSVRRPWWLDRGYCFSQALLALDRMKTPDDFTDACGIFEVSLNLLYANTEGDIAYQFCGHYPMYNRGHDPRIASFGGGSQEWPGVAPFRFLPKDLNPRRNYLLSWNNKPGSHWVSWYGRLFWGQPIYDALQKTDEFSTEQFAGLAARTGDVDYLSAALKVYAKIAAVQPNVLGHPLAERASKMMVDDDEFSAQSSATRALYKAFALSLLQEVFGYGGNFPFALMTGAPEDSLEGVVSRRALGAALARILNPLPREEPNTDYLKGRMVKALLAAALLHAVDELAKAKGDDSSAWGDAGAKPAVEFGIMGRIDNPRLRGSYRQMIELGSPIRATNVLRQGESAAVPVLDGFNQAKLYDAFQFKPMALDRPPR